MNPSEFEQGRRSASEVSDRLPVFDIRAGPYFSRRSPTSAACCLPPREFEQGNRSVSEASDRLPVFDVRAGP